VGGNTSTVEVRCGDARFVLDAGTGMRALGNSWLAEGDTHATLLLSHLHWDHIQGLPFFTPLYSPSTRLHIVSAEPEPEAARAALAAQMRPPTFPVDWTQLPSTLEFETLDLDAGRVFGDVLVRGLRLPHPGGDVTAYRIDYAGRSVVYATDVERSPEVDDGLLDFARGVDVLIHDAQYTPEEYRGQDGPSRRGWGHSTFETAAQLARAAGVGRLLLFHHDPSHDDEAVARIEARARWLFPYSEAAKEGQTIELGAAPKTRVA
jgi:phosphoribosyl 1,2-cyclic phosphodiesterase